MNGEVKASAFGRDRSLGAFGRAVDGCILPLILMASMLSLHLCDFRHTLARQTAVVIAAAYYSISSLRCAHRRLHTTWKTTSWCGFLFDICNIVAFATGACGIMMIARTAEVINAKLPGLDVSAALVSSSCFSKVSLDVAHYRKDQERGYIKLGVILLTAIAAFTTCGECIDNRYALESVSASGIVLMVVMKVMGDISEECMGQRTDIIPGMASVAIFCSSIVIDISLDY